MTKIDYAEFLRAFKVLPNEGIGFFLGSGCSVSAGIPTGNQLIWELKRNIYCSSTKTKEEVFNDLGLRANQEKIQSYFDQLSDSPKYGSNSEYSYYFEKCYPQAVHRKMFLKERMLNKEPTLGHLCLGSLIENKKVSRVFTTNFDDLIEKGILTHSSSCSYVKYSEDNKSFPDESNANLPWIMKLHGDYLYDSLANTENELKSLEERFHSYLQNYAKKGGLILVGYSGSEESILGCLENILSFENPFPNGFYWAVRKGEKVNDRVEKLIEAISSKNALTGIVEIESFDEFCFDLADTCRLTTPQIESRLDDIKALLPFNLIGCKKDEIQPIKLNSLKIVKYPSSYYKFDTTVQNWKELRATIDKSNIVAGLTKGKILALGDVDEISKVFKEKITSEATLQDFSHKYLSRINSVELGLIYEQISKSLETLGLNCVNHKRRLFYAQNLKPTEMDFKIAKVSDNEIRSNTYEAFEFQLEIIGSEIYFVINPTVHIAISNKVKAKTFYNQIISNRYNKNVGFKLGMWLRKLKVNNQIIFKYAHSETVISNSFSYADIGESKVVDYFNKVKKMNEPLLRFNGLDSNYSIEHPLKGLSSFGPFSSSLTSSSTVEFLKISVIAPKSEFGKVESFFKGFENQSPCKSEQNYLLNFTSIVDIFKKRIDLPRNSSDSLFSDLTIETSASIEQFYEEMKRRVDQLETIRSKFDLLVIYFPNYWEKFRERKDESVYFDLHDSIKIYCAKKNIKVQFLNDKSFGYFDEARVKWWLSLAMFTKSGGTPWVVDESENTAFIGLSYSVSKVKQNKVTIGMSQVFDSKGRGARFFLNPISKPIFIGKTPYMSKEDSRRLINSLKEVYFNVDTNAQLKKLVIHKTTPFISTEIEGILQATKGIEVELLHIQQYPLWRGVKGDRQKKESANYPVDRGTTIQLDDNSFLLFTHGNISNANYLNTNKDFYKGARGIPAPLKITRYAGKSPIEDIANDIMKLTKMNWNAGELYKTLPVTIDFSKVLSRYSKQDELLLNIPYDFRYFI